MEIKKKREYIIVIMALSLTLLCCIAYIIYDKTWQTYVPEDENATYCDREIIEKESLKTEKDDNTEKETKVYEELCSKDTDECNSTIDGIDDSIAYATNIMKKYKTSYGYYLNNLGHKEEIAVNNLTEKKAKCQDIFNLSDPNVFCSENEDINTYSYENVSLSLKQLFGSETVLKKEDFSYGNCGSYHYIEKQNYFAYAGSEGCGGGYSINTGVSDVYFNKDEMYVWAYSFTLVSGEEISFFTRDVYKFKKQGNDYYLSEIINED